MAFHLKTLPVSYIIDLDRLIIVESVVWKYNTLIRTTDDCKADIMTMTLDKTGISYYYDYFKSKEVRFIISFRSIEKDVCLL